MIRKIILFIILTAFIFITACGAEESENQVESKEGESSDQKESEESTPQESEGEKQDQKEKIGEEDFEKVYSNPEAYKGYEIELMGQVFVEPEKEEDGVYLQVYADPENNEKNTIVGIGDPDFEVSTDDYVKVTGVIQDTFEGENAFGGQISAPTVSANNAEVVDYETAISPAIETIEVDEEQDQHGYVVHVDKIEFAENMTRVYLEVSNNTDDEISFYSFNSKLILDNEQLEEDNSFFDTGLPELQSDILPDVETDGVIIFPAIDPDTDEMTLHTEGSSSNFDLDIDPFTFEVSK